MGLLLTCEDVAALLPDYEEGILSLAEVLRVKFHLFHCPGCRALLATMRALPSILARALPPEEDCQAKAQVAFQAAMARIQNRQKTGREAEDEGRPWPSSSIPQAAQRLLDQGADLPLQLLASTHRILSMERRAPASSPPLPEAILKQLPPEALWRWEKDRDGLTRAELLADPTRGQRLVLVHASPGSRMAPHRHLGSESLLVLAGSLIDQGHEWAPGTWLHHGRGSSHAHRFPESGCWYLVREEGTIRFHGINGWLRKHHAAS